MAEFGQMASDFSWKKIHLQTEKGKVIWAISGPLQPRAG